MNTPPSTDDPVIVLEDATKSYGRALAVESVTLEVPRSCVFGLIGPNGAGKTTLIKMAMGLLRMTSGRATVLGQDASTEADAIHRLVGYVPEVPTVYRWMKVAEVIRFCRSFRDTWNDDLCGEVLDTFSLDPAKKVKQLSKGMLTKLSLLLATAYEPEVLILDEPTSGLDAVIREEFLDSVLKVICQRECTVLYSSHAIEDVERIADRVGILLDGRLHVDAPVDELLSRTRRVRAVLDDGCLPKGVPKGTIWQQVDQREWLLTVTDFTADTIPQLKASNPVEHVEAEDLSLTQLFKDYVKGRKDRP